MHRLRRAFAGTTEWKFIDPLTVEHMLGMTQQVTNILPVLKPLTFTLLEAMQCTHEGELTPVILLLLSTVCE